MVNKTILLGRLGHKPSIRYTQNGTAVASFSIATSERYETKTGEKKENVEWHDCVIWGKDAENLTKLTDKGSLVYVEGSSHSREYETKSGEKRKVKEIKVHTWDLPAGGTKGQPEENVVF